MEKLQEGVKTFIDGKSLHPEASLRNTAKEWACYVLEHNCGEALGKGLEISKSICRYLMR